MHPGLVERPTRAGSRQVGVIYTPAVRVRARAVQVKARSRVDTMTFPRTHARPPAQQTQAALVVHSGPIHASPTAVYAPRLGRAPNSCGAAADRCHVRARALCQCRADPRRPTRRVCIQAWSMSSIIHQSYVCVCRHDRGWVR